MANSDAGMSNSNVRGGEFQVFLNFRGPDTRSGFMSFLHQDLKRSDINVFMDEEKIKVGEEIEGELLQALNGSQMYIPVFSKNYAESEWCLRELAIMVDKSNSKEKKILPIFYDVKPKDVNLKTPIYRTALEEHKKKFPHEVESWEKALEKVHAIKGWELSNYKSQAELVGKVVDMVLETLKINNEFMNKDFFGIEGQVAKVLELLDVNCSDKVVLLGLCGIGGIGKSTLARLVYNKLSSRFGKCCAFLDDIREMSKKKGLVWLQKKLLTEIASSNSTRIISGVDHGRERIEETLGSKKVLIILDDVDKKEQIENLIGQRKLHPGTRIIITAREKSVLETFQQNLAREMKEMNSDYALQILSHEMENMSTDDALKLFKKHAFLEGLVAKDFNRFLENIVFSIGGIPLAIKVIGSLLCGKPTLKWEDTSEKLKDAALEPVQEKLMISYKDLSYDQREIFLDIACFFINEDMMNTIYMWKAPTFDPDSEINVLVKMSLIKIENNNKFWMHDQLRDLGREIIRGKSPDILGKQSRLRITEENLDFIATESKKDVEALDLKGWSSHIPISHEEIARFERLRFLRLSNGTLHGDSIVYLPKLKWISWHSPSPDFSVARMHSNNLVVLQLFNNQFTDDSKVWHLIEMATKLKNLALVKCHGIIRTPDLSKCRDLERLTFDYCKSLKEIDRVIELTCLVDLNITHCGLVERVPDDIRELVNLQRFSLKSCDKVRGLPNSIGHLTSLQKLDLSNTSITSLPKSIGKLSCLSDLNLLGSEITEIPDEIEELVELRHLCLKDTKIKQLPESIGKLKSLCTLDLSSHESTELDSNRWKFPKEIGRLKKLEKLDLSHRVELEGEIPDEIELLSSLSVLDLCRTGISGVPGTINMLHCLSTLDLRWCDKITALPDLPASLLCLRVESRSLQVVPNLSKLTNLVELVLSNGSNYEDSSNLKHECDLRWIGRLSKLKKLELCLLNINALPMELGPLSLLEDLTWGSPVLQPLEQLPPSLLSLELVNFSLTGSLLSKLQIPSDLTLRLSRLQNIQLNGLSQLQHLHLDSCELQSSSIPSSLKTLNVINCPKMIEIQSLEMPALLEELSIDNCQSIRGIELGGEVLDQSESSSSKSTYCSSGVLLTNAFKKLKRLRLRGCTSLLDIQVTSTLLSMQYMLIESCDAMQKLSGIWKLKDLRHLDIDECSKLEVVEGLDKLKFLRGLDVKKCPSLERLLDISNSKIPDECLIRVSHCRDSIDSPSRDCHIPFKCYKKMMAQQGAPQPQTSKEEAKLEGDAEEPIIKLQLQFHPSASSQDHNISKEPPIDNVMEGTPPGNQIQTRQQDSNHLSISPLSSTKLELQFHPSTISWDHEINKDPPIYHLCFDLLFSCHTD